ncbi:MAG: Rubrerythrin [Chloroflexota bacterium]
MAFQDPLAGIMIDRPLTDTEVVRALRLDLASEEEAISTYMTHVDVINDDLTRMVLSSIADEERIHVGELQMLIDIITGTEFQQLNKGMKEVSEKTGSDKTPQ